MNENIEKTNEDCVIETIDIVPDVTLAPAENGVEKTGLDLKSAGIGAAIAGGAYVVVKVAKWATPKVMRSIDHFKAKMQKRQYTEDNFEDAPMDATFEPVMNANTEDVEK